MRLFGVMLWFALALPVAAAEFPYTAYVTARDTFVRSGPGNNFYPTDRLQAGQAVEVYRHDPDGWYAIRPTEGSFTWVSARHVQPVEDGLGRVTGDRVAARIGSRFSNVRDVIQIRLQKNEIVEILDEFEAVGQTWYKIAPPSGEFRWISDASVDRQRPHEGVNPPRRLQMQTQVIPDDEIDYALYDGPAGDVLPTTDREPASEKPFAWQRRSKNPSPVRPHTSNNRASNDRASNDHRLTDMLDGLEEELSLMVAERPTTWQFDQLHTEVKALVDQVETEAERERVRQMLHKIARFKDIRRRYQQGHNFPATTTHRINHQAAPVAQQRPVTPAAPAPQTPPAAPAPKTPPAAPAPKTPPAAPAPKTPTVDLSGYDGVGVLKPVISRQRNAPRFALVDHRGEVISFVTPARGVTLDTLIGRKIGVNGTRGYMPEYRRPHVVAERVAIVDGPTHKTPQLARRRPSQPAYSPVSRGRY